jgi:general secretion pathway protein G
MLRSTTVRRGGRHLAAGLTLIELVVATGILLILAGAAIPTARLTIKRQREAELRRALREMRDAIDRYKDLADRNLIQVELGTEGYPPELEVLVRGVKLAGAVDRRIRFLRRIPEDPMTGGTDWGLRSVQDDFDARSWGGQNVFDVYSKSSGSALDGSRYTDW